jgi:hypothetical protein
MKTQSITIPFPGFYYSILDSEMDNVLEREVEYMLEMQKEERLAKHEMLDEKEFREIFERNINYKIWQEHIAQEWVESFSIYFKGTTGLDLPLSFEEMTSPREYNFETDRVFASAPSSAIVKLFKESKRNLHVNFAKVIEDSFTRRDGFIPHYSNDIEEWTEKPITSWDHNEVGTLIASFLQDDEDLFFHIYEGMSENGDFDEGLWKAIDYDAFQKDIAESRLDKLVEILADDPDFVPPAPRCPLTIDMGF